MEYTLTPERVSDSKLIRRGGREISNRKENKIRKNIISMSPVNPHRPTSVIAVPDDWHDGTKVTVRISKKINEKEKI